jgi:enoyl-CoA hydratase
LSVSEAEVLFEQRGAAGMITLNRPQALNAFTFAAVRAIRAKLKEWATEPDVSRVVIQANGKAFAAGGDIRTLVEQLKDGRYEESMEFFREEYSLNYEIKHYPKPYVALIDGICMGGGVGLSVHGRFRVAGDRYLFAMPEVSIGFFPDVGATHFLPRLPGRIGTYLALTAARLGPGEGIGVGTATHRVPSSRFPELLEALSEGTEVSGTLAAFSVRPEPDLLVGPAGMINRAFTGDRVETVLDNLRRERQRGDEDGAFADAQIAAIGTKSPTSLKIALEQMRRGATLDFTECMRTEMRIVSRVARGHDFFEGVRAIIIDKDNAPKWSPPTLDEVTDVAVAAYFEPLASDKELPL